MFKSTIASIFGHVFVAGTCLLIATILPVKEVPCFVDLTLVSIQTKQEKNTINEKKSVAMQFKHEKQCGNRKNVHERSTIEQYVQTNRNEDSIVHEQSESLPEIPDSSGSKKIDSNIESKKKETITGTVEKAVSVGDTAHISFTDHTTKETREFSYIAAIISKNTRYPPLAEEMEVSGTVVIEFVVSKNGVVNDLAIVKSSGYEILDNDAIRTIKISSPFPSARVTAKIRFPMEYRLTSAD